MRIALIALAVLVASGAASAQVLTDDFSGFPTNWTQDRGIWTNQGNTAASQESFLWQYCTYTGSSAQDCVLQCDVIYDTNSVMALQFGGVAIRANGAANDTNLIMCKYQDNNSNGQFDRLYVYDRPGGTTFVDPPVPSPQGRVRLLAIDKRIVCQIDTDGDGAWDATINRTSTQAPTSGPIGITGFGGALIDNFAFFDAVVLPDTGNLAPTPGSTQKYNFRGLADENFQAALSFGNTGIGLGAAGTVPLAPDALFFASIAAYPTFADVLDGNGDKTVSVAIPPIPALIGQTYYIAFVTYGGSITGISNEHRVTIT